MASSTLMSHMTSGTQVAQWLSTTAGWLQPSGSPVADARPEPGHLQKSFFGKALSREEYQ